MIFFNSFQCFFFKFHITFSFSLKVPRLFEQILVAFQHFLLTLFARFCEHFLQLFQRNIFRDRATSSTTTTAIGMRSARFCVIVALPLLLTLLRVGIVGPAPFNVVRDFSRPAGPLAAGGRGATLLARRLFSARRIRRTVMPLAGRGSGTTTTGAAASRARVIVLRSLGRVTVLRAPMTMVTVAAVLPIALIIATVRPELNFFLK